jgi:hypothetical protein
MDGCPSLARQAAMLAVVPSADGRAAAGHANRLADTINPVEPDHRAEGRPASTRQSKD